MEINQAERTDFICEYPIVVAIFYEKNLFKSIKMMEYVIKACTEIYKKNPQIKLVKVDVTNNEELAEGFSIEDPPLLVIFHNAQIVNLHINSKNQTYIRDNQICGINPELNKEISKILLNLVKNKGITVSNVVI